MESTTISIAIPNFPYPVPSVLGMYFSLLFEDELILRIQNIFFFQSLGPIYQFISLIKSTGVGLFWISCEALPFYLSSYLNHNSTKKASILLPIALLIYLGIACLAQITPEWNHMILLGMAPLIGFLLWKINGKLFKYPPVANSLAFAYPAICLAFWEQRKLVSIGYPLHRLLDPGPCPC